MQENKNPSGDDMQKLYTAVNVASLFPETI